MHAWLARYLRWTCHLLWVVLVGCGWNPDATPGLRVEALDCTFTLPADYLVEAEADGTSFFRSADPGTPSRELLDAVGRIEVHSASDDRDRHGPESDLSEAERKGHLQILEYVIRTAGREFKHARVRGLTDEMDVSGAAMGLVDDIVRSCVASADPVIVRAVERRAAGCQMLPRERFDAFFEESGRNVVFADGRVRGWRIYDKRWLETHKLSPGELITEFCGTGIDEIVSVDGDICCSEPPTDSVTFTVQREEKVVVSAPLLPLQ